MESTFQYLKPHQYYSDLYDKHTVEHCRWWLKQSQDTDSVVKNAKEKNLDEKEATRVMAAMYRLQNYFYTGERYIKKEETIKGWVRRDEEKDKLLETAAAPENITCFTCGRLMFVNHKHLNTMGIDGPNRVLFMYGCSLNHVPSRAFYNDGEEYIPKPSICPKCKSPVTEENKIGENKIITTATCSQCGYVETSELDLNFKEPEKEKIDPNFAVDRARFCLSEKDGQEFIREKDNMDRLGQLMDKIKEKENNKELYDKVTRLKKLKILELEELLSPILGNAGYIKLQFKNPEITKDVIVPFVIYDQKVDREDRTSTYELEVLIRKTLKDTNWRLMTDGTNYRLGMLEGRLRGYEREEDLLKLVQIQEKKETK